ncbi:MAG TPA: TetR family transcriptional regulator [Alphaproteobacteria bacterium]|nr:TetR family transcriptional regulator [Alphaproteobacteria bacterium]
MAKNTPQKSLKDRVVDAALALAAEEGWNDVSFEQIAAAAQADMAEAREYFDDKTDILVAYGRRVDRQVLESASFDDENNMSTREKLFDLLMERFDVLNENREAIVSILSSFRGDPKQAVVSLPHLAKSMTRTMEAAGVDTEGAAGAIKVTGLIGVYLYVVRTWKEDESADMARTMAALDKALDNAEMAANSFSDGSLLSGFSSLCNRFTNKENE